mmetsp:Transcript_3897/g.11049  ORF Transcript_3897/g.11049 Transcript_3897/m.11049 type:complete len:201 (-) Transcript_3897:644-1246(-)
MELHNRRPLRHPLLHAGQTDVHGGKVHLGKAARAKAHVGPGKVLPEVSVAVEELPLAAKDEVPSCHVEVGPDGVQEGRRTCRAVAYMPQRRCQTKQGVYRSRAAFLKLLRRAIPNQGNLDAGEGIMLRLMGRSCICPGRGCQLYVAEVTRPRNLVIGSHIQLPCDPLNQEYSLVYSWVVHSAVGYADHVVSALTEQPDLY